MGTDDDGDLFRKRDPFEAAMAALEKAKDARRYVGQDVDDKPVTIARKSAEQVLEEARLVRELAGRSPAAMARENAARVELQRLRSGSGYQPRMSSADEDEAPTTRKPPKPKKRTL